MMFPEEDFDEEADEPPESHIHNDDGDGDDSDHPSNHINYEGTAGYVYAPANDVHHLYPHGHIYHRSCNDLVILHDDHNASDGEEFVEYDPSGTYGRYSEVLGKGAMKTVYRAYHLVDCKEVAWNKSKIPTEGPEEQTLSVQREVHLLKSLKHKSILKLYSAWVNESTGETNFITELCSSTLLNYRLKHKHISRKAVASWCRQILEGLAHLHMQDPPIIHRDLKCENIFVKCTSNDTLKIGDFGSATVLDETHHMHTLVGTPEFMAPEMFQEDYNELVDIYSFGMCMLELLTREYPYSECKSLAQIYRKVINGEKPQSLLKVKDVMALQLINRCLLPASERPSAMKLLDDPFLQCNEGSSDLNPIRKNVASMQRISTLEPTRTHCKKTDANESCKRAGKQEIGSEQVTVEDGDGSCGFRRTYHVSGKVEDENTLSLRIRIQESSKSCDIDFQFDLRSDTPTSVAEEMVRALGYPQSDLVMIADLISRELAALVTNLEVVLAKLPMNGQEEDDSWRHKGEHLCTSSQVLECYGERAVTWKEMIESGNEEEPGIHGDEGSGENTILMEDKPPTTTSLPSATNDYTADILVNKADVSMNKPSSEGSLNAFLGKCLYWNNFSFRNHTKFQHIPAGIGILLTPSKQGFRRPFNAFV